MICDSCKNHNSIYCDDCIYSEHHQDFYEHEDEHEEIQPAPAMPNISEWVDLELPEELKTLFGQAAYFTSISTQKPVSRQIFACVHVAPDSLYASDGAILVELHSPNIPKELIGRNVVVIEPSRVGIYNDKYPDVAIPFRETGEHTIPLPTPKIDDYYDIVIFTLEAPIIIHKQYYQRIIDCLTGDIQISYTPGENKEAILFTGSNGRVVVMPIRPAINQIIEKGGES